MIPGIRNFGELANYKKTRGIKFQPNDHTYNTCLITRYVISRVKISYFQREEKDLDLPPGSCLK